VPLWRTSGHGGAAPRRGAGYVRSSSIITHLVIENVLKSNRLAMPNEGSEVAKNASTANTRNKQEWLDVMRFTTRRNRSANDERGPWSKFSFQVALKTDLFGASLNRPGRMPIEG
jgi:hypothetical protein